MVDLLSAIGVWLGFGDQGEEQWGPFITPEG